MQNKENKQTIYYVHYISEDREIQMGRTWKGYNFSSECNILQNSIA